LGVEKKTPHFESGARPDTIKIPASVKLNPAKKARMSPLVALKGKPLIRTQLVAVWRTKREKHDKLIWAYKGCGAQSHFIS